MPWAEAIERLSGHNVEHCPRCGAQLAPVTVVLDPEEIQRTLALRGLLDPLATLTESPSRGPPILQLSLLFSAARSAG